MKKNELSSILYEMISNAEKGNIYVQYHLFGIKYVEEILSSNFSIEEIVESAGIRKSLASEIRKGIKLSDMEIPTF